jgi:hypothetical protein
MERLGARAQTALKATLEKQPVLDIRRRVERLLERLGGQLASGDELRDLRAVEVLESIGTAQAGQISKRLATGCPDAPLTQEAKATLERLARRPQSTP